MDTKCSQLQNKIQTQPTTRHAMCCT